DCSSPASNPIQRSAARSAYSSSPIRPILLVQDQYRGSNGCGPLATLIADSRLGDVAGADDLVGDAVDFLFLVPALVGVEFNIERGGKHLRGQLLGIFPGLIVGLAET